MTAPLDETVAVLRAAGCVFAEDEAGLLRDAAASPIELAALVARRVDGEPLEQIVGWAEFAGRRIPVEPGVFVPRRRTALLVELALAEVALTEFDRAEFDRAERPAGAIVVDLCCGTAALAAAVGAALGAPRAGRVELHAADVDPVATRSAARTLAGLGAAVHTGDLYDALPGRLRGRVDVLLVNAPYVPTGAIASMPPEARLHEPRVALDGGADGLDLHRRVAAGAPDWLAPGGVLLLETSEEQADRTAAAVRAAGLETTVHTDDELGATAVRGRTQAGSSSAA